MTARVGALVVVPCSPSSSSSNDTDAALRRAISSCTIFSIKGHVPYLHVCGSLPCLQRVTPLVVAARGVICGAGAAAAATVTAAVGTAAETTAASGAVYELTGAAAGVEITAGFAVATTRVEVAVVVLLDAHVPYLHVAGSPPCLHLPPLLSYSALTSVLGAGLVSVGPHGAVPVEEEVASPLVVGPAPTKVTGDGLESLQMNEFDLRRPVVCCVTTSTLRPSADVGVDAPEGEAAPALCCVGGVGG